MLRAIPFLLLPLLGGGDLIPLKSGEIVVGEITSHDEDGLDVKRLDNGGVVRLRWSQLAPTVGQRLRAEYGYVFDESEEVMVDAVEVTLAVDGSTKVGILVESTPEHLVLREKESVLKYPRAMVSGAPRPVQVPALLVFTREQLYNEALARVDASSAAGNLELSRYLERIHDYARALDHAKKSAELDPAFHPQELQTAIARLAEKAVRQAEYERLGEIEIQRNRRAWDKAIALCVEFPTKFPKSLPGTRADVEKRKANIEAARRIDLIRRTSEKWHEIAEKRARKKAGDRKLSFEAAKAAVQSDLRKEIVEDVTKAIAPAFLGVTDKDIQTAWSERGKSPATNPKVHTASYGQGTWALGREKAREGLETTASDKPKGPAKSKEEEEMEKKIKRFLERQQGGGAGGAPGQPKVETAEDWWERAATFERGQFLLAFYAEFGGDMTIVEKRKRPRFACAGTGRLEFISTGGSNNPGVSSGGGRGGASAAPQGPTRSAVDCPACHGVGLERVIAYR